MPSPPVLFLLGTEFIDRQIKESEVRLGEGVYVCLRTGSNKKSAIFLT